MSFVNLKGNHEKHNELQQNLERVPGAKPNDSTRAVGRCINAIFSRNVPWCDHRLGYCYFNGGVNGHRKNKLH